MIGYKHIIEILTAALCVAVAVGCEKDPGPVLQHGDVPISFRTVDNWGDAESPAVTKASGDFGDGYKMGVYSYFHNYNGSGYDTPIDYMTNLEVTKNTSGGWDYGTVMYWPLSDEDKLSFYAYGPYSSTPEPGEGGVIKIPYANIGKDDIVWADLINNQPSGNHLGNTENGTVNIGFEHKLAQLRFRFKRGSNCSQGWSVNNIKISGAFPHSADLNVKSGTWTYDANPTTPTTTLKMMGRTWTIKNYEAPDNTIDEQEAMIYVVPVGTESLDISLMTDYGTELTTKITFPESGGIAEGKSYVIDLTFELIEVLGNVSISVEPWAETTSLESSVGKYELVVVTGGWNYGGWEDGDGENDLGVTIQ